MTGPVTCRITFEEENKVIIEGNDAIRNAFEKVALVTFPLLRDRIEKRYETLFFNFVPEGPPLNFTSPEAFFSQRGLHVFAPKFERERDLIRMILEIFIGIYVGDTPYTIENTVHSDAQKFYGTLLRSLLNEEIPKRGSALMLLGRVPPSLRLLLLKPELNWLKMDQRVGFTSEISLVKAEALYLMELCRLKAEETFVKNPPLSRRFGWEMDWPPNNPSLLFFHYLSQIKEVAPNELKIELDDGASKKRKATLLIHTIQRLSPPENPQTPLTNVLLQPLVMDHIQSIVGDQLNDIQIYQSQSPTCSAIINNKYLYLTVFGNEPKYLTTTILVLLDVALNELQKHPEERYILVDGRPEDEILSAFPPNRREALLTLLGQLEGFSEESHRIRIFNRKSFDLKGGELDILEDLPRQIRPRRLTLIGGNKARPQGLKLTKGSMPGDLNPLNDRKDT